ncbi:MAG: hypothetical protein WCS87_06205 [Methylococcaceae bacterium]
MRLSYVVIGWGIVLVLIGFPFVRAYAVLGTMNPSTTLAQPKKPSENSQATPAHRIELDIPADSYFAGTEGRSLLKYLVRCALDNGTEAHLSLPGEKFIYMGGVGLAPEWAQRALTLTEQRWVSACIFALTNKLGKSVRVDLRAAHPKIGEDTEEEKRIYLLHEGGFFGNLFLPVPVSYVCEGTDRKKMLDFPIGKLRLCAQPSGTTTPGGQPLSPCGFIITGSCNSPSSFVVNGERLNEVVHTWLPPEPRE